MSSGELIVIVFVTFIVFGPKKLPMLASHLGLLLRKLQKFKTQASVLVQQHLNELQLQENQQKAKEADEHYKNDRASS